MQSGWIITLSFDGVIVKFNTGSVTLLFQRASQPGLEIQTPDHAWSAVPVFPLGTENDDFPPILVNIGDLLSYWTKGLLKSTVHRVTFPPQGGDDRYSIAYFCHPNDTTTLAQIPSALIGHKLRGQAAQSDEKDSEVMTAAEHLKSRLASTYGWKKE